MQGAHHVDPMALSYITVGTIVNFFGSVPLRAPKRPDGSPSTPDVAGTEI